MIIKAKNGLLMITSLHYLGAKNSMLLKSIIFTIVGWMLLLKSNASFALSDSTKNVKGQSIVHWRLTTRIHNQGIFTYGGRLATENPTVDVNFIYDRKKWGLLIFKGLDLRDHNTFYNFALISVYKNFKLSKVITVTPYVGSFLEQGNGLADHGSDLVSILITTIKLNQHLTAEHMSLFSNLVFAPEERDWVNRFRLTYSGTHLDVVSTIWWNNQQFDHSSYWTSGLNIAYSRLKMREHLFLSIGVTGLLMLNTSNAEINPEKHGLMFTLGVTTLN